MAMNLIILFSSFIVSSQSIKINDYNRVVKDLNGNSEENFYKNYQKTSLSTKKGENNLLSFTEIPHFYVFGW